MNLPTNAGITMTSLELVDLINDHRKAQAEAAGQPFPSKGFAKLEHADFLKKVPDVLGLGAGKFSGTYLDVQNKERPCYRFPKREACLLAMSYSYELQAAVFDRMTALEQRPMTQAELIAASANQLVAIERQQAAQQVALERVEQRVEQVETLRFLTARPAAFESISHIRERINKRHGLPAWVVDLVMRELNRSPMPFAMVKSERAEEGAKPYPIWPTAGVTRLFDQFVAECQRVTAERATHPEIADRFKIRPERAV